ncbi:integrase [Streptomyces sp. NPDC058690]|uniref:integrase n=1 Tax=Streptomyces sp. NPDC058690 TaxID=3346600 RepID=UPI003649B852
MLFRNVEGRAVNRVTFNRVAWRPALDTVGVPRGRENGTHALRHFYASVLLDAGESIKALSEYLGHHDPDPGFTLRTYTHLMPSSERRTRGAVNRAFEDGSKSDDGPMTAQGA